MSREEDEKKAKITRIEVVKYDLFVGRSSNS